MGAKRLQEAGEEMAESGSPKGVGTGRNMKNIQQLHKGQKLEVQGSGSGKFRFSYRQLPPPPPGMTPM